MMRKLGLICSLAFALLFSSSLASAQDAASARTYAGVVKSRSGIEDKDQPIRVGVTIANGKAMFFFCGDANTVTTGTQWFTKLSEDGHSLENDNGWFVYAWRSGAQIEGYVWPPQGKGMFFSVQPVSPDLGLYRAKNELGTLGVIVTDLDNDGALELQGALKSATTDQFSQIVPVSSKIEVVQGELEVNVPLAGGGVSKAIVKRVDVIDF